MPLQGAGRFQGFSTFKSGIPLSVIGNDYNSYGGNPRPDVTGDPHIGKRSLNECSILRHFPMLRTKPRTAPRYISNLRAPGTEHFDLAIYKNWKLPREMQMQFRAEMYNAFNHPNFYAPNTSYPGCDPNAVVNCPFRIWVKSQARSQAAKYRWQGSSTGNKRLTIQCHLQPAESEINPFEGVDLTLVDRFFGVLAAQFVDFTSYSQRNGVN